ncbi:BppU family phage baseplate upper protein, partial [Corynebacterium amycolatum]
LDINTAMLTFQLKKGIYPLQISKTNADIHVFFESTNGSQTDKVNVEFVDSLNGVIRFVVDNEFLSAATDTWVTGQIYLTAVGRADTVVLNVFQFFVKDALINKIGAD